MRATEQMEFDNRRIVKAQSMEGGLDEKPPPKVLASLTQIFLLYSSDWRIYFGFFYIKFILSFCQLQRFISVVDTT